MENKPEWKLIQREGLLSTHYVILHIRCRRQFIQAEKCPSCSVEIPKHFVLQREMLNGK